MKAREITRRDRCFLVGKRAGLLTPGQAAKAWRQLAYLIELLGHVEGRVPKFNDLLTSVRKATIVSRK